MAEFQKDKAGQIAAALTYHTLFSLLPVIALALVILRTFVGPAEQLAFKDFVVDAAVDWLIARDGATGPAAGDQIIETPTTEFDATIALVDETIMELLDRLQNIDFQGIGAIGVLLFFYAATGLLVTIERSFNQIYGVKEGRRWHYRLPLYYTTITLAPLVIIAGQVLQEGATAGLAGQAWSQWLAVPLSVAYPVLTTWLVFYLLYLLIPNARVDFKAAGIGSGLAAVASVTFLELFSVYIDMYAGRTLYGSLALLPLAMLWLWLNWLIILFGLEVAYVLQTGPTTQDPSAGKRLLDAPDMCDPRWLIVVLSAVAERFAEGRAASLEAIALRLRIPEGDVGVLAERLVELGLLHRVQERDEAREGATYVLARSPDEIEINELYDLWPGAAFKEDEGMDLPGGEVIARLEAARSRTFASLRLRSAMPGDRSQDNQS